MNENFILQQLQILKNKFAIYWSEWSKLGQESEFRLLPHGTSIRAMFAEGKSITNYLVSSLETKDVGTYTLLHEYVERVESSITPGEFYERIGNAADQEYRQQSKDNYTVGVMLRLYNEQKQQIAQVQKLLTHLRSTPTYRLLKDLPKSASPMQVIAAWTKMWEGDVQLHRGLDEVGLRAQLTAALRSAGFTAISEGHAHQGHADIVIPSVSGNVEGNQLVVECKIWHGESAFEDAVSQLCRYVTPNDHHAALVIFVRPPSFLAIANKAKDKLEDHACFENWLKTGYSESVFALRPAQDPHRKISATLLMCNLAVSRY
ncbi:hypothetical protein [Herbaspirillum seropedicae]|uniref:hypothetical protein n=1 Tax=Herbaspirillum seropedicae TaxID=964 RepID=UPI003FCCE2A7